MHKKLIQECEYPIDEIDIKKLSVYSIALRQKYFDEIYDFLIKLAYTEVVDIFIFCTLLSIFNIKIFPNVLHFTIIVFFVFLTSSLITDTPIFLRYFLIKKVIEETKIRNIENKENGENNKNNPTLQPSKPKTLKTLKIQKSNIFEITKDNKEYFSGKHYKNLAIKETNIGDKGVLYKINDFLIAYIPE